METSINEPKSISHLPKRPPINIDFQDLNFSVPGGRKGQKIILRNISGSFHSGQLTAILGPSGAGKSTLLNILAGYNWREVNGLIKINGEPRNIRQFRKLSRYIMQDDLLQPLLTVKEYMMLAADLKLSDELSREKKLAAICETLQMLRLIEAQDTPTNRLSGGERKRLCIALELVNNPPVVFLDEPISGLDDVSSFQCISLLKSLAQEGRSIICSIHSPSAKLFSLFDHVYILTEGQCVYQGKHNEIVSFLQQIDLNCPKHYNPADFIIEVSSGEYGNYLDKMVSLTENGRSFQKQNMYTKKSTQNSSTSTEVNSLTSLTNKNSSIEHIPKYNISRWAQFKILLALMSLKMLRNTKMFFAKIFLYILLGIILGNFYINIGNDGSKTIFNFGFCFTCLIVFMYCPLLNVLLNFPTEVKLIKREYFNQWYSLPSYFSAMTVVNLPVQLTVALFYVVIVFFLTNQPWEFRRALLFYVICFLVMLISESIGMAISSTANITNGTFLGTSLISPLMLLSVYGFGSGEETIPLLIRFGMSLSYLRYAMKGLAYSIYGFERSTLPCPEDEEFCIYMNPKYFLQEMGMKNIVYWYDLIALTFIYVLIKAMSFYLLRQRLNPNKTFAYLHLIGRLIKSYSYSSR